MLLAQQRHRQGHDSHDLPKYDWPRFPVVSSSNREDELLDRLQRFPAPNEVEELVSGLKTPLLRQLTTEVINGSIVYAKSGDRLEHIRLLNSWIATAEETVAAGRRLEHILARRKENRDA